MDNSYSKGGDANQQESIKSVPIKIPKNLRQVGSAGSRNKAIYVEDYVMTYIKQLADKEHTGCRVAVLMGYYVKTEEGKNIFVKGAVEMTDTDFTNGIVFSDEGWTSMYENIKKYFSDVEIVGWSLTGPGFFIESEDKIRKVHMENFQGPDKILLKLDSMEKEESFYISENNQLVKQAGYYIYYEKNEEMQNYMVDNKESAGEEKNYSDHTTKKIRNVIQEKKEVKDDNKSVIRLLYAASTLLAIIVLVIAATMLDNYDKMRNMETALNTLTQSLNLNGDSETAEADESDNPDLIQQADNHTVDDKEAKDPQSADDAAPGEENSNMEAADDKEGTTEVETVKGNVEADPESGKKPEDSENNKPADTESNKPEDTENNKPADKEADKNKEGNTKTTVADKEGSTGKTQDNEKDAVEASAPVKYYTVKAGDSLAAISFELYHTFSYMDEIKEINGIEDEDKIYEGQKLILP